MDELSVSAGDRALVDRVSFDVARGEIVAVIGPSGAGKTTMLEAVTGLRPASGVVTVNGAPMRSFRD